MYIFIHKYIYKKTAHSLLSSITFQVLKWPFTIYIYNIFTHSLYMHTYIHIHIYKYTYINVYVQ